MALSIPLKTELNESCREIVNDTVRKDYSRNKAAVERVVASLHDDGSRFGGWVIMGWVDFEAAAHQGPPLADWTTGQRIHLRRDYEIREARPPAKQAFHEVRGEVAAGDNTYTRPFREELQGDVGDKYRSRIPDTYGTVFELAIGLAARCAAKGKRPIDRTGRGET